MAVSQQNKPKPAGDFALDGARLTAKRERIVVNESANESKRWVGWLTTILNGSLIVALMCVVVTVILSAIFRDVSMLMWLMLALVVAVLSVGCYASWRSGDLGLGLLVLLLLSAVLWALEPLFYQSESAQAYRVVRKGGENLVWQSGWDFSSPLVGTVPKQAEVEVSDRVIVEKGGDYLVGVNVEYDISPELALIHEGKRDDEGPFIGPEDVGAAIENALLPLVKKTLEDGVNDAGHGTVTVRLKKPVTYEGYTVLPEGEKIVFTFETKRAELEAVYE